MTLHEKIQYKETDHGSFDDEWLPHKKVSGWWYATGYLIDEESKNMYSYQYTVIKPRVFGTTSYVSMIALTDFQTGEHFYHQRLGFQNRRIYVNQKELVFHPYSKLTKNQESFEIKLDTKDFNLNLTLDVGKGAFWHGDDGVLVMGTESDPKQRTLYYSYTNMPTKGELTLKRNDEKPITVKGKTWFDRQWGPYDIVDNSTHWEWFSLRFFDDEEVMIFYFPQHPYLDGTYITKDKQGIRLRDCQVEPLEMIEIDGFKFSKGWKLKIPGVKEENYTIKPLMDGQLNLAYYELMASILNEKNEEVGYCFVELLQGARNPNKRINPINLFKRR